MALSGLPVAMGYWRDGWSLAGERCRLYGIGLFWPSCAEHVLPLRPAFPPQRHLYGSVISLRRYTAAIICYQTGDLYSPWWRGDSVVRVYGICYGRDV